MRRSVRVLALVIVLLAVIVPSALAWNGSGDRVVFGEDLDLREAEVISGDLVVFGGDVYLRQGSQVEGDLFIMGGELRVAGEVDGDVVLLGGSIDLESPAVISGDVLALGGMVERHEGSSVGGTVTEGFPVRLVPQLQNIRLPSDWWSDWNPASTASSWAWRGARSVIWSIALGFIAVLVTAIWPSQTKLVSRTLWSSPGACVGAGVIASLIAVAFIVVLVITICLSPVAALALAAAWLFGWCALGLLVGQRLLRALKVRNLALLWQAAVGVLVLSLIGSLPCVGWMIWVLGGMYAFGAVVLTRLGTRPYDGQRATGSVLDDMVASGEVGLMIESGDETNDLAKHDRLPDLSDDVLPEDISLDAGRTIETLDQIDFSDPDGGQWS